MSLTHNTFCHESGIRWLFFLKEKWAAAHGEGDIVMMYDGSDGKSRKIKESTGFLETLILDANAKFFEDSFKGGGQPDDRDYVLYTAVVRYFKGR